MMLRALSHALPRALTKCGVRIRSLWKLGCIVGIWGYLGSGVIAKNASMTIARRQGSVTVDFEDPCPLRYVVLYKWLR
jgi:hypothetical protein